MSKIEPKYNRNDKIEFVLRDTTSRSGYSHHCGYAKRAYVKRRLFWRSDMFYDIVEATKEGRIMWHDVPEADIIGIVEQKPGEQPLKRFNGKRTSQSTVDLEELEQ